MDKIIDNLYLGDRLGAEYKDALLRVGITHIVNMTDNITCKYPSRFQYIQVKVADSDKVNIKQYFSAIF